MFARYLAITVEPIQIGYYERVAESAVQYAERLLSSHAATLPGSASDIANKLVYGYKDHGFVIDKQEATSIFGSKMVKTGSVEYELGNAIYSALSEIEHFADLLGYRFYLIGTLTSRPGLIKKSKK